MSLLNKFSLGEKYFLSVGLRGMLADIRITSPGKQTYSFTPLEFAVLHHEREDILRSEVQFGSTIPGRYGGFDIRKCVPDESTGALRFMVECLPDAQQQDLTELTTEEYVLPPRPTAAFAMLIPKVMNCVKQFEEQQATISLAYDVVRDQMKRLFQVHGQPYDHFYSHEHFLYVMQLLHQYVPVSFLAADFRKRSPGTLVLVRDLFHQVLSQFEYMYSYIYCAVTPDN